MTLRQVSLGLLTASIIYSASASAAATAPGVMLKQAIRNFAADATKPQPPDQKTDSAEEEQRQSIVDCFVDLFDINGIAAEVAGSAWDNASTPIREEFTSALTMTIVKDWTPVLRKLKNENVSLDITPLQTKSGSQHALSNFVIRTADADDIPVTLKLIKYPRIEQSDKLQSKDAEDHQRWLVEDVVAHGQSMVQTYSNQYRSALAKHGLAPLAKRLESQLSAPIPNGLTDPKGWLQLKILVLADGTPGEVKIIRSSGYSDLDDAAVETIESWHFKPAKRDGRPIRGYALQNIIFDLSSNDSPTQDK